MKALFNRFKQASKDIREQPQTPREKEKQPQAFPAKGLPEWPPQERATPTPVSKPLPDIVLPDLALLQLSEPSPSPVLDLSGSTATKKLPQVTMLDQPKKVAFISPPGTPAPNTIRPLDATSQKNGSVAKLAAAHDTRVSTTTVPPPRAPSTTANKATTTRNASSPTSTRTFVNPQMETSAAQSLRSGTPFSQASSRTGILTTASWSEAAEEDLVSNLGPRERTRQEVLWEIVASEERYVTELLKMRETFIEPLLHPYSSTSPLAAQMEGDEYYRHDHDESPVESFDHLPIASRFLSPLTLRPDSPHLSPLSRNGNGTPVIPSVDESPESEEESPKTKKANASKINHPRSPYGTATRNFLKNGKHILPFPTRSHHSLPAPTRANQLATSTASLGRQSYSPAHLRPGSSESHDRKATSTPASRVLRKLNKKSFEDQSVPPHLLPDDLRRCLEVIEGGIINGHLTLSAGLRKRYDDQYPLVRSLADVFVAHSQILHEYATYVLHLERALEQVDSALSTAGIMKRPKNSDASEWLKISKLFQRLEETAADKGETGLAISLSKPFQRLLKYPLLFQNLLFHTDPSTYEYEATLRMVAEVETIVRSIEDEKIQKEERDKTRDVFARIEGLEKVKILAVPKPSRLLVEEKMLDIPAVEGPRATSPPTSSVAAASPNIKTIKQKSSFRRISEVLQPNSSPPSAPSLGSKKDLWLVVFNDVVLRCQRTGTTSLPLASSSSGPGRSNSMPDIPGKAKYATSGRRHSQTKPRNMYKFIKVETWTIGTVAKPREGIVSMEDIGRSRFQANGGTNVSEEAEEEEVESDDSDRKSKMSFSYWGADRVTIQQKPVVRGRGLPSGAGARRSQVRAGSRLGASSPVGYGGSGPSSYSTKAADAAVRESAMAKREIVREQKFGTRLRSPEPSTDGSVATRPASRRTQPSVTPSAQRRHATNTTTNSTMDDTNKATIVPISAGIGASGNSAGIGAGGGSRPAWDASVKTPVAAPKRSRNVSATSGQTPPSRAGTGKMSSPAPSEDSGVGLYRQMIAQDSGLKGKADR